MRSAVSLIALGLGGAGAVGCGLFEGLQDQAKLLDPPATSLHLPGVRVAKGEFERLTFVSHPEEDGIVFAAIQVDERRRTLRLFRPEWGDLAAPKAGSETPAAARSAPIDSCLGGDVTDFEIRYQDEIEARSYHPELRVFFDEDGDGRGTLRFLDERCGELAPALSDVEWGKRVACVQNKDFECIAVFRAGDGVYRTVPGQDGASLVAATATDFVVVERFLYTTEGDLVVQRDLLEELPEMSKELPGATFEPPTHRGRYQSASIRTPNGLWAWPTSVMDPLRVADEACGFVGGTLNRAYLAPCDGGTLIAEIWSTTGRTSLEFDVGDLRPAEIAVIGHEDGTNTALVWLAPREADPSDLGTVGTLLGTEWRDGAEEIPPLELVDERARFAVWYRRGVLNGWSVGTRCSDHTCDEFAGGSGRLDLRTLRGRPTEGASDYPVLIQYDSDTSGSAVEAVFSVDGTVRLDAQEWEGGKLVEETTRHLTDGVIGYRFRPFERVPTGIVLFRTDPYDSGNPDIVGFVRNSQGGATGELHLLESASLRMTGALADDVVPTSMVGLMNPPAVFFRTSKAPTELHVVFVESELEEKVPNVGVFLSGQESFPGLLYATTGEDAALWYAPPKF